MNGFVYMERLDTFPAFKGGKHARCMANVY